MTVSFRELKKQRLKEKQELVQLQNGQKSHSPEEEEQQEERIMGLDRSTWEDHSYEERERSIQRISSQDTQQDERRLREEDCLGMSSSDPLLQEHSEAPVTVVIRDRARTLDEVSQKTTRAKRESRRMRELEQAKFSLELLKVRATCGGASSPSEERRWSAELLPVSTPPLCSPQGTPDSQSSKCSFELLSLEEVPPRATIEELDLDESGYPELLDHPMELPSSKSATDSLLICKQPDHNDRLPQSPTLPAKIENYLPTFYVPTCKSSSISGLHPAKNPPKRFEAAIAAAKATTTAITSTATTTITSATVTSTTVISKALKDKRETGRRPVVVVISMQKATPLREELSAPVRPLVELQNQQPGPAPGCLVAPINPILTPAPVPPANLAVLEKLERLNEEKEERQRSQQQQSERQMMEQIRQQKEVLERQRLLFAQNEKNMFEKQRGEALHRIQQSRQVGASIGHKGSRAATSGKAPRPNSLLFERTQALAPHTKAMSEFKAPGDLSFPGAEVQPSAPQPRSIPLSSFVLRETLGEGRPIADGWVPKLTLESRYGRRSSPRLSPKKTSGGHPGSTVNTAEKSGNIFFSPKDKVVFAK